MLPGRLRMKGIWSQNGADQILISGYGVRTINPETDCRNYSNTEAVAGWIDFSYLLGCDNHELGFFVGGTKNLGSQHKIYIDPLQVYLLFMPCRVLPKTWIMNYA